ncbi:MAG: GIY-YIG nuclease family protein [Candidatus Uhrbacteria bacterium]|nr:GIY-YIG nuclease family protein [Candidatus Uhrbacteria bacterium]
MSECFFVYIMANPPNNVLYIGFTSDLAKRVYEHRNKLSPGFTKKYNVIKCVYYEVGEDYDSMLAREKQLKNWRREKKDWLISKMNPDWKDLYDSICE